MKHLDLFSGIGGFSIASEAVFGDVEHIFVEIDPFCQAVLKKHWPHAHIHDDIRTFTNTQGEQERQLAVEREQDAQTAIARGDCPFLLTGGFPCQPFSQAGRRRGTEDDRFLWPEMLRVIREFHPTWIIAENVRGLLTQGGGVVFEQVCTDLEGEGYDVQPIVIPAVAVNAPHRRDRVWFIANTKYERERNKKRGGDEARPSARTSRSNQNASDTTREHLEGRDGKSGRCKRRASWNQDWTEAAARLCSLDDGLSNGLVRPRGWRNAALKAAGNAIVPQVAIEIMKAIKHSS